LKGLCFDTEECGLAALLYLPKMCHHII